jgi:hypothetical protein
LTVRRGSRSIFAQSGTAAKFDAAFSVNKGGPVLDIDEKAKEIVQEIGTAINEAVENSPRVAEAIDSLREAGYEMELTLRLEIALRSNLGEDETNEEASEPGFTDEDLQILQRMKIRIDPD